ncbi:MAG: hypothetical protein JSW52_03545 [Candidatus Coatesbacteria bacterium]|nr:MAG: hypothetical protein JSW52_03545 [Candidatus Coatesbacteria bacterium]
MQRLKNGEFGKTTAVILAVAVALTAAAFAFAEDELSGGDALVSVYADLKAKAAVDGEAMGFTPVKGLELSLGAHEFEFTYRDYAPQKYEVEISAGTNDLYFQLEPRLEEQRNKFNVVDLVILIGVAAAGVTGFVLWGKR